MARDRRRRIRSSTGPHRPRRPHEYRDATREGSRGFQEELERRTEAARLINSMTPEEAERFVYTRLAASYGAYLRWSRYWERRAEELERAGRVEEAAAARAKARQYYDIAMLENAILAEIRQYGFQAYVIDRLMEAAVRRREPEFPELERIPGRVGEYLRALANRLAETMWARGRGMRDWGLIICDPAGLEYLRRAYSSYRFRVYFYVEDVEVREWETGGGRKYRSRAIHVKYREGVRGDELDWHNVMRFGQYRVGVDYGCVEVIPE